MAKYKDWLKTFYCGDDHGKEIIWGRIMDIANIKDEETEVVAVVYASKNPISYKIRYIPFSQVERWVAKKMIWSKRK